MTLLDDIRQYWDDDAPTYDDAAQHRPRSALVQAAWTASLEDLLPPPPARVLDCGAGTGFLSLIAARLGHRVTALDLSPAMLARLGAKAGADGLDVETGLGSASEPPGTGYDVVIERHLVWTLPDPAHALTAWRTVAPAGRLVLVESLWGQVDPVERRRADARRLLRRLRGAAPEHHAEYGGDMRRALPFGTGTHPDRLVETVARAGWPAPRARRLRDVEWAERSELGPAERLLGVTPRFAVVAG
jgi:SAM-dependent methyltransferase